MSFDSTKNFAVSTLASGIDDDATSLTIQTDDGAKFPNPPFNCVIWNKNSYSEPQDDPNLEIVRVTEITDDTFTILRAQEGTIAHSHSAGDRVELNITAKIIDDLIEKKTNKSLGLAGLIGGI